MSIVNVCVPNMERGVPIWNTCVPTWNTYNSGSISRKRMKLGRMLKDNIIWRLDMFCRFCAARADRCAWLKMTIFVTVFKILITLFRYDFIPWFWHQLYTKKYIIVTRNITYGHLFARVSMQFDITMEFYHIFMAQIGYLTVHCSMDNENYLKCSSSLHWVIRVPWSWGLFKK